MAKILVVDDAAFMRMRCTKLLQDNGYDTVEAGSEGIAGREVHERLAGRPNWSKLFQASEPTTVTGREQDELHG